MRTKSFLTILEIIGVVGFLLLGAVNSDVRPPKKSLPRAFLVFGDSLVDSGNNNYLATTARADSPPYGIDYPTRRPTGRFSNGYNIPDIISQKLGAEPTLPYLSPNLNGQKLLVGANFASAGIGILNDTGFQFVNIINIGSQLSLFRQYQKKLGGIIGEKEAKKRVNGALVLITLGGNDFVNNYFLLPTTLRRLQFRLPAYCKYLISEYRKILKSLYDLEARRVLVTGSGPLGCVPGVLATRSINGRCAEEPQLASKIFNKHLIKMIKDLNKEIGSQVFVAVNAEALQNDFINNPQAFDFVSSKIACCGQGAFNGVGLCTMISRLCQNRSAYAFWDAYHPTERANKIIVEGIMIGAEKYITPMNLSSILAVDAMKY